MRNHDRTRHRRATLKDFVVKGRFREFMHRIPLRVILNDRAALLGSARHALHGAEELVHA